MPTWEPNRDNVKWDHHAADAAIRALRSAANLLEETATQRRQRAAEATAEWRGRYRDEFDGQLARMLQRAAELAGELQAKADEIARASDLAREEQARRERERERWREEKEAEERAALNLLGTW